MNDVWLNLLWVIAVIWVDGFDDLIELDIFINLRITLVVQKSAQNFDYWVGLALRRLHHHHVECSEYLQV